MFSYFYFIKSKMPWVFTKQAYADNFSGFNFTSLNDISLGKNKIVDHLCNCIIDYKNSIPEDWPENSDISQK